MIKRVLYATFYCLLLNTSLAQVNSSFIQHLSSNALKTEHWTYLQQLPKSDSSLYYTAKFHLQYGNDSAFISTTQQCSSLFLSDTLAVDYTSHYFIDKPNPFRTIWFESILDAKEFEVPGISYIYYSSLHPHEARMDYIPIPLQKDFLKFSDVDTKRPFLAATLSAIVPGTV